MPSYTYTDSASYVDGLSFDYAETYSFQRGQDYQTDLAILRSEQSSLKANIALHKKISSEDGTRLEAINGLLDSTQYLLDQRGCFHPSSRRINIFQFDDPAIASIRQILKTEITYVPRWMCSPIYRDAIVFYDRDGQIVSTLNVCLSCQYMETEMFQHIDADYKVYHLLKQFFIEIGHEVEDPEHSILEEFENLKRRYGKL
jgi:hypothetical protein